MQPFAGAPLEKFDELRWGVYLDSGGSNDVFLHVLSGYVVVTDSDAITLILAFDQIDHPRGGGEVIGVMQPFAGAPLARLILFRRILGLLACEATCSCLSLPKMGNKFQPRTNAHICEFSVFDLFASL